MQLRLVLPISDELDPEYREDITVRTEADIRTAGFAVGRAVRTWLRRLPFVPSTSDLHFNVYAEVVPDEKPKPAPVPAPDAPPAKRKRARPKRGK